MKNDQGLWNFLFSVLFITILVWMIWYLWKVNRLPFAINVFDFLLVVLASFRVTRLFVYDAITQFVRDWFLDVDYAEDENGDIYVSRQRPFQGPRSIISQLMSCPWCFGMWASMWVSFIYFATPFAWFLIFILAVAGIATLIQLIANAVGWTAEEKKLMVEMANRIDEEE
jgi:hypothetical protein